MFHTPLCDLLDIRYPILQGGMAWIATAELSAAVSEAGGLGILGGGNAPPDYVRDQIRKTSKLTHKPFGVNIPLFSPYVDAVVETCIEEGVPVVSTGAGNPARGGMSPCSKGRADARAGHPGAHDNPDDGVDCQHDSHGAVYPDAHGCSRNSDQHAQRNARSDHRS